jgi:Xaa-Pro aminopeptidase
VTASRLARARGILDERELDALLVSRGAGRRWLAGFVLQPLEAMSSGYAGTLLVTHERAIVLADARYTEQAAVDCRDWEIVETKGSLAEELVPLVDELGVTRLGAEAGWLSHATWLAVAAALDGVTLDTIDGELTALREIKDAGEVAALERACALTDACFDHLLETLRPGLTERDVARRIDAWFAEHGAEGLAFDSLVLVGARGAMPHGRSGEVELTAGEPVLIDFGCVVDGYHSDMTRTVFLGEATPRQRELYGHVLAAQARGEAVARVGVSGSEVHQAAVEHLAGVGYAEAFTHGLGHGIGLEIHEAPSLKTSKAPLAADTVFTIEPGIYLSGEIGIRIEDDYHLTDAGPRRLTQAPRDLIVI